MTLYSVKWLAFSMSRNMGIIWELDFYSRPVLDDQEKKLWEVLICESPTDINTQPESLFRYSQFCSSSTVNSIWLGNALKDAIAIAPNPPEKIRFFRRQMANMISKGCDAIATPSIASRRTFALTQWIDERMRDFYPTQPGYQEGSNPSVQFLCETPQPLPEALVGEKWAFVSLEVEAFAEMGEWDIGFGESFNLSMLGLPPQTQIPGLIIYSSRATAIAGWMAGLELASLLYEPSPQDRVILETGASDRWIVANLRDRATQQEGERFEAAKEKAKSVHFLAIQSNPKSESFAGFWLMRELIF
jgi:RNA-binding protein Tab2/Atab2